MQMRIFSYRDEDHFDRIRTVEIDGKVWFVAADVAKALGYSNSREAIARHCKQKGVVKRDTLTNRGNQEVTLINEPNVYRLIVKSQLPSAEKFEAWVFEEVLPSIRATGTYGINRLEVPNFMRRYMESFNKIPKGYFSVITELYVRLYAKLEHAGYQIPNKSERGKEIRPDVSVGQCFPKYLRDNYPSAPTEFETYTHTFGNGVNCEARLYPSHLVSIFWDYVDEVWIPTKAEEYFRMRDPLALEYLPKLLQQAI